MENTTAEIEVIESSFSVTENKKKAYQMMCQANVSLKEVEDGMIIEVEDYCIFKKDDAELLSIMSKDNVIYVTNSLTCIKTFRQMLAFFEPFEISLGKVTGTSKAGRNYIDFVLAG